MYVVAFPLFLPPWARFKWVLDQRMKNQSISRGFQGRNVYLTEFLHLEPSL